ncbi:MAG: hypothetical protein HKO81_07600 [Flavobacteriaceae bacterium]|nr:hypothetical protein [Flavobacteriaceae bacterium]
MGIIILSLFIVGVLVFSIFYFLLRRLKPGVSPLSNKYYWIISILSVPIVFAGGIYLWFLSTSSFTPLQFDQKIWLENSDDRYLFVDDLIENRKLIGLSNNEIKLLLSEVEYEDDSTMQFYIGYSPKTFLNLDPDWLVIELKDGKADRVYIQY